MIGYMNIHEPLGLQVSLDLEHGSQHCFVFWSSEFFTMLMRLSNLSGTVRFVVFREFKDFSEFGFEVEGLLNNVATVGLV